MQLTLYHYWRSSCSWRLRWALALKGLDYTSVPVNILAGEHQKPDYFAKNPTGLLPAIKIDDQFYGESMAIMEWLDETVPTPPLLPAQPLARLKVRQLALTIVAGTQPLQNPLVVKHYAAEDETRKAHARHWITRGLQAYETLLKTTPQGPYSYGDSVTLADLCLIPQVYNASRFDVALDDMPRIRDIYQRCLETKACQASHPSRFEPTA